MDISKIARLGLREAASEMSQPGWKSSSLNKYKINAHAQSTFAAPGPLPETALHGPFFPWELTFPNAFPDSSY
jgi:hypothetical protein